MQDGVPDSGPMFPGMMAIARDRPHRYRSVQKGFWQNADEPVRQLLSNLVTGPRSFARLLESSLKFYLIFQKDQKEFKHVHTWPSFAATLKNLSFSESRFDFWVTPFMRLFRLLPICIQTLTEVTSFDDERDANWAAGLLEKWSGDRGYTAMVTAAVVADALLASQSALRVEDSASADFAISGPAAAEVKQRLKALLLRGGLFLQEVDSSLTHCALRAIQGKVVFVRSGTPGAAALALRWPSPDSPGRRAPLEKAKKFQVCCLNTRLWQLVLLIKGLFGACRNLERPRPYFNN